MSTEPDDTAPNTLSPRTTPTWELELLISGATIFGLLQLPELLDQAYALYEAMDDEAGLSQVLLLARSALLADPDHRGDHEPQDQPARERVEQDARAVRRAFHPRP